MTAIKQKAIDETPPPGDGSGSKVSFSDMKIPRHKSIISIGKMESGERTLTLVDHLDSELKSPEVQKKKRKKWMKCLRKKNEEEMFALGEVRKDYLDEVLYEQGYDIRRISFRCLLCDPLPDHVLEYLSLAATYTVTHYFGAPGPNRDVPARLFVLLQHLNLPHRPPLQASPPAYRLQLKVVEAKGLAAMDAGGLSDPFCRAYLLGEEKWAQRSETQHKTLNPVWNHPFWFNLKDFRADVARVEVWDSDPKGVGENIKLIRHVRSLRGCWMCCQDFCESLATCGRSSVDDFIGSAQLDVGRMFADGFDDWLLLVTEKGKDIAGEVHIRANVEVERPLDPLEAIKRHLMLIRVCMEYSAKTRQHSISEWDQLLPQSAETLIFQHRLQSGIRHCEDLMCKTCLVVELAFRNTPFTFGFFYDLLSATQEAVIADPSRGGDDLSTAYHKAIIDLHGICMVFLKELHTFDVVEDLEGRSEVEHNLRCVGLTHPEGAPKEDVWVVIKADSKAWLQEAGEKFANRRTEEVVAFAKMFKSRIVVLDGIVGSIFPGKTYTVCVFRDLETSLCDFLEPEVKKAAQETLCATGEVKGAKRELAIQLFCSLKDAVEYISRTLGARSSSLRLGQFQNWFGYKFIHEWFCSTEATICALLEAVVIQDSLHQKVFEISDRTEWATKGCKAACDIVESELVDGIWKLVGREDWRETMAWTLHRCCWRYATAMVEQVATRDLDSSDPKGLKSLHALANSLWAMGMFSASMAGRTVGRLKPKWPHTKLAFQLVVKILCRDFAMEAWPHVLGMVRRVAEARRKHEQEFALKFYKHEMRRVYQKEPEESLCLEAEVLYQDCLWTMILREVSRLMKVPRSKGCWERMCWFWGGYCCPLEGFKDLLLITRELQYHDSRGKIRSVRHEEYEQINRQLDDLITLSRP